MATKRTRSKLTGRKLTKRRRGLSSNSKSTSKHKLSLNCADHAHSDVSSFNLYIGPTPGEDFDTESSETSDSPTENHTKKVFTGAVPTDSELPAIDSIPKYPHLDQFFQIHNLFVSNGCQIEHLQPVLSSCFNFLSHYTVPPEVNDSHRPVMPLPVIVWLAYANTCMYKAVSQHQEEMKSKTEAWQKAKTKDLNAQETKSDSSILAEINRSKCEHVAGLKITQPGKSLA